MKQLLTPSLYYQVNISICHCNYCSLYSIDSLTIQVSYTIGEDTSSMYLVNRSAFLLPSSLSQNGGFILFCIGLLGDSDTEIIADTINSTAGFSDTMYIVSGQQQLDNSGDFIGISFFQFLFSYNGNYTCRSRSSGAERTVFLSSKCFYPPLQTKLDSLFFQIIKLVPWQCYCHHQ